ncbi:hypothetical protein ASG29_05110 [Sphingomonas sp. Leaf412]|uniref:DUF192 domain-containing protein n=1 Tax=Sphingomonas sp. Leaf412 TaxID=1736370 RepID=UPI0006F8DB7D|nr:DUF192 domain-containing protein [Sphingomonas sp. Leaf412]KQT33430.1 hypothetical protein ASG29_05110 [Sphingomonas sp. Leaf412]
MIRRLALAALLLAAPSACKAPDAASSTASATIPLTIESGGTRHAFRVELAKTPAQQQRGLMFRPPLADDAGMLFFPYPADGGPPREASFWMKDTPSPLDIVFIRADRTIAAIGADTIPFSEIPVTSGEPVAAVLELRAGRAAELGLREGDKVGW